VTRLAAGDACEDRRLRVLLREQRVQLVREAFLLDHELQVLREVRVDLDRGPGGTDEPESRDRHDAGCCDDPSHDSSFVMTRSEQGGREGSPTASMKPL